MTLRIVLALALVGGVACGSAQNTEANTGGDRNTGSQQGQRHGSATSGGDTGGGSCGGTSVYFAYDSSELDARARNTLEGSARCLQRQRGNARITGMADPRGTEEYNLALGDRRARSVVQYMSNMGVEPARMTPRSVGEEQASGRDEGGWANDRRAEIQLQ